jgi:hypothetical protein
MPEGPEIDTDKLRETIDAEIEKEEGGGMLRWVSLTTALLAAIAAVASLRAGDTVNEALALKSDATRIQAQASDQWAYYQAKGIKGAVARASAVTWKAAGKPVPADLEATAQRYDAEQKEISVKAKELESERDAKEQEAASLLEKHHNFAAAVALFQVAIALGAVSALTRNKYVWYGSLALGAAGVVLFAIPLVRGG